MKTKEDLQAMSHGELVEYALEAQNNILLHVTIKENA